MPPTTPKPATPDTKPTQSAADLNAQTDASRASHTEPATAPPAARAARKPRAERTGPNMSHQLVAAIRDAYAAGVPFAKVEPILDMALSVDGVSGWGYPANFSSFVKCPSGADAPCTFTLAMAPACSRCASTSAVP